jgi:hypothetical protein
MDRGIYNSIAVLLEPSCRTGGNRGFFSRDWNYYKCASSPIVTFVIFSRMRSSILLATCVALSSVTAAPLEKKANYDPLPRGDTDILNYALTLEYLERKFYQEGLANYTEQDFCNAGFSKSFYKNLVEIYEDEKV